MAKSFNKRLILAKAESSYGVTPDPAPAGSDAVRVVGLEVEPLQVELVDRELIQGYFGNSQQVVSQKTVGVKFSVELTGSGTVGVAPRWGCLMKACGFAETIVADTSVTYSPVSSSFSSVALDFRNDGIKHLILGVRGNAEIEMKVGEIPKINFEFQGLYGEPTDTANPAATFSGQADPLVVSSANTATVSVHGFAACMSEFKLDLKNDVTFRQLAGCTQQVMLTNRKPEGEISIELPSLSSKNFYSLVATQTEGAISWVHGGTAGNIVTLNAPYCSFDSPSLDESDGIQHISLPFRPMPSSSGNDELTLALT